MLMLLLMLMQLLRRRGRRRRLHFAAIEPAAGSLTRIRLGRRRRPLMMLLLWLLALQIVDDVIVVDKVEIGIEREMQVEFHFRRGRKTERGGVIPQIPCHDHAHFHSLHTHSHSRIHARRREVLRMLSRQIRVRQHLGVVILLNAGGLMGAVG